LNISQLKGALNETDIRRDRHHADIG
jgi:hypothetical protein